MNWGDANNFCEGHNMKLAAVSEIREMYSLARSLNFMETDTYWTAGKICFICLFTHAPCFN